jgi:hypothetical protein
VRTPGMPGGTEQGIGEARTTGDDVHAEGAEQVGEGGSVTSARRSEEGRASAGIAASRGVGVTAIAGTGDRRSGIEVASRAEVGGGERRAGGGGGVRRGAAAIKTEVGRGRGYRGRGRSTDRS